MLRTLLTYRPRPSLVWSVGFHAALGVALWGSGLVRIPLQGSSEGLVVTLASPVVPAPEAAPEREEPLPLESQELELLEPEFDPNLLDALRDREEAPVEARAEVEAAPVVARALTRRHLPTRRRKAQAPAEPDPEPDPVPESRLESESPSEPQPAVAEAEPAASAPVCAGPVELTAHCPPPPYPRSAERRGLQGTVELQVFVHADGHVEQVRVSASSGHAILDDAARSAVLTWRYAPATMDGRPVARTITKRIAFQIP